MADDKNTAGAYVREIASNGAEAIEPALPSVGRLGVSYDEGGEGLGDPAQVAQASAWQTGLLSVATKAKLPKRYCCGTVLDICGWF